MHPSAEAGNEVNSENISLGFTTGNIEETKSHLEKLSFKITEKKEEVGEFIHFNYPDGTSL